MNISIIKDGLPLDKSLYTWDQKTKTFSSAEDSLVITSTGYGFIFKTGSCCTFDTGFGCTFDTGSDCTFKTGFGCTFKTDSDCIFKTGFGCTFDTGSDCTFDTGSKCVVVRRDIYEVIELEENIKIKLNKCNVSGWTLVITEMEQKKIDLNKRIAELQKQVDNL